MSERAFWKRMDWWLLGIVLCLQLSGLFALASATFLTGWSKVLRQGMWMGIGWVAFFFALWADPQQWARWATWIYWANIALLVLVLVVGHEQYGAQRWLRLGSVTVQPSEFAKAALIITLATFLTEQRERLRDGSLLWRSGLHIALPFALVFLQPDLGTSLVLIAIWLGGLFFAGVPVRSLMAVIVAGLCLFAFGWRKGIIKDYQKQRLLAFVDPYSRANREGYHIIQSQLAIGSGGMWGKGLFRGRMGKLGFVPAQHTDFIFTVVGEEGGFVWAAIVVGLFAALLARLLMIAAESDHPLHAFLVVGIFCFFAAHITINIGMTLRLMPITGLPLPFFSAGGSNLVVCYFLLGIAQSVATRRRRWMFA
jgi:rod shape determining protein RodA